MISSIRKLNIKTVVIFIILFILGMVCASALGCGKSVGGASTPVVSTVEKSSAIIETVKVDSVEPEIKESDIYKTYNLDKLPKLVNIDVKYPAGSKKVGIVYINAIINENGRVVKVVLAKATTMGEIFEKAAIDAVRQASFEPGRLKGGKAVITSIVLPIKFMPKSK